MAGAGAGGRRQRQHADVGTAGAGRAAGAELAVSQVRWAFVFFGLFLMFSDCGREGGTRGYLYAQGARCEGLVCLLARVAVPLLGLQSHSICRGYRVHHAGLARQGGWGRTRCLAGAQGACSFVHPYASHAANPLCL